jgi:hypothetical protein
MPASNMGGPGGTGNPSTGSTVIMSPFSGPKGSPFDKDTGTNYSTGALCTGIGFGLKTVFNGPSPTGLQLRGFNYHYVPGVTMPDGVTAATDARLLAIGGGRSNANVNGIAPTNPYVAQPILAWGNGGSRDGGVGPAFTGFGLYSVSATAAVAVGAAVEAGYINRSLSALAIGQSVFGSNAAASPAVT